MDGNGAMVFAVDTFLSLMLSLPVPSPSTVGCCTSEMLVPWNELVAVVEDVLSMLSTAAVVNTFALRLGGQTVSVSLKCSQAASATSDDSRSTLSYEIDGPRACILSISSFLRVFTCSITFMYTGKGVS